MTGDANTQEDILKGFGEPAENGHQFRCFIFIRDCLLTVKSRIGRFELIPFEGIEWRDEIGLIQNFMMIAGTSPLQSFDDCLAQAKAGQPTIVMHFPVVNAETPQMAMDIVAIEANLLCDLLSVNRGSNASILGIVCNGRNNTGSDYRMHTPSYEGNLIGGFISGEDPGDIKHCMKRMREEPRIQLYLSLFKQATREDKVEFIYFRLWSILETIAHDQDYKGCPLCDWDGNVIPNGKGKGMRIEEKAEQLVFELVRRVLTKTNTSRSFMGCVEQKLVDDMVPIWYRHRNCVGHQGGCFPDNPNLCKTQAKYANCKKAHNEIVANKGTRNASNDDYLMALELAVKDVINYLLFRTDDMTI